MALKKEKETKNKTHPETMPRGGEVGGRNCQPGTLSPVELSFKNEGEIKDISR